MAKQYGYRYTPSGESKDIIVEWIKNQADKKESFSLLIKQAIHKYGTQDLIQLTNKAFLEDNIPYINQNNNEQYYTQENQNNISTLDSKTKNQNVNKNPKTTETKKEKPKNPLFNKKNNESKNTANINFLSK